MGGAAAGAAAGAAPHPGPAALAGDPRHHRRLPRQPGVQCTSAHARYGARAGIRRCDPAIGWGPDDFFDVAPDTVSPEWDPTDLEGSDFHAFALEDRFNYQPFNHLVTPNERFTVFGKAEHDVSEHVNSPNAICTGT